MSTSTTLRGAALALALTAGLAATPSAHGSNTPVVTTTPQGTTAAIAGGGHSTGPTFDTCETAGNPAALAAWRGDFDTTVAYLGGATAACPMPASQIKQALQAGWKLLPAYVGLQAPSVGSFCDGCETFDPGRAREEGIAAARDAMALAAAGGIGPGSPLYYDMEYYENRAADDGPVLEFLRGWTETLRAKGYRSGVYGDTAILALTARYHDASYPRPDAVWIHYEGATSAYGLGQIPDDYWRGHRIVQYDIYGNTETHGGVTMKFDRNFADGDVAVAGATTPAPDPDPQWVKATTHTPGETLAVRSGPTTAFPAIAALPHGTTIELRCQWTKGTAVTGPWGTTTTWDKINLPGGRVGYVSDAWVYTGSNGLVTTECGVVPTRP